MELIVALDVPTFEESQKLIQSLRDLPITYKVGSELFLSMGPDRLRAWIEKEDAKVFLDLKFHDIPNTVGRAVALVAQWNLKYFTVHLSGGVSMLSAARTALDQASSSAKMLGVSVLTSFDETSWATTLGATGAKQFTIASSVSGWVKLGVTGGIDGVVCSGHEVAAMKRNHPNLQFVVPGVRPSNHRDSTSDQKRILSPEEAKREGADAIVVGRPITQSDRPREVVEDILRDC